MVKEHKGVFALGVSMIALAVATPVRAADAAAAAPAAAPASASDTDASPEVVVTGIRASIQASLDQKRKSDMVSEVLTAQDIGKFPDKNVADSLGRLTGVNVVTGSASAGGFGENQNVSIRGTDPGLNLTLLDGHSVATGDWFVLDQQNGGRSFDFSLLPSEIVGSLEVYKSSEADLQEGGIGGTINLHSRKPLDLPAGTVSLTGQMVYNDLASKWTPQASGLVSWKNADNTFGILVAGFFQKRDFRRDGQEFLGYQNVTNFAGTGQTVAAPNLIGAAYFRQQRTRKGGLVAVEFKPTDRLEINLNGIYTRLDADNVNTNSMAWVSRDIANNSTPGPNYALANYTISNGYLTSATFNPTTTSGAAVQGRVQDDIFRKAFSSTLVANADFAYHATDKLNLTGEVGYTKGVGETKDTFAWETYWNSGMSYTIEGKTADVSFPGLPTDETSQAYLNNYYSWSWGGKIKSPDTELYGRADLEYTVDNGFLKSIKVGGRFAHHKRAVDYTAYAWPGNGQYSGTNQIGLGTVFSGDVVPSNFANGLYSFPPYPLANEDKVRQELDSVAGGRQFAFYPPLSFSTKETTEALYAMAKLGNDSDWRGNVGVRAVHTKLDTVQYSPNAPNLTIHNAFGNFGEVDDKNAYWDILPSANLTYNIQPDLLIRGSVAKVMSRPAYAQLAGAFSLSDLALTGTAGGNPHLKPTRAWEYNLGAEWYYGKQALLSATFFYLDIQSYIMSQTTTQFYTTLQHPQGANFLVTAPVNGPGGHNQGFEINWQQPLWYGFGVIANYTYADAKAKNGGTIDGNSKNTYNLTGYFEDNLISARVAYTYRSKFSSGVDRGTAMWQDNYGQLDASVTVHLTHNIALTADAQNLLNHNLYYFVGDPSIPRAYYNNGRTFWLGGKVSF